MATRGTCGKKPWKSLKLRQDLVLRKLQCHFLFDDSLIVIFADYLYKDPHLAEYGRHGASVLPGAMATLQVERANRTRGLQNLGNSCFMKPGSGSFQVVPSGPIRKAPTIGCSRYSQVVVSRLEFCSIILNDLGVAPCQRLQRGWSSGQTLLRVQQILLPNGTGQLSNQTVFQKGYGSKFLTDDDLGWLDNTVL